MNLTNLQNMSKEELIDIILMLQRNNEEIMSDKLSKYQIEEQEKKEKIDILISQNPSTSIANIAKELKISRQALHKSKLKNYILEKKVYYLKYLISD